MKSIPAIVFAAMSALTIAVPASAHESCTCNGSVPAPPAPPAPPAIPAMPTMPAPPAPPAPPPAPVIPSAAHAACAAKAPGFKLNFSPKPGTTMEGYCERDTRGMYFELRSMHSKG